MLHRSLDKLSAEFKPLAEKFIKKLVEAKIDFTILETKRDLEVQQAYYAQGREELHIVNLLRKRAGLYLLSENENKRKVTWTLKSPHLSGNAIDICPTKDGKADWNAPDEIWKKIADIGVECGLDAGYYWTKTKDSPHFSLKEK